MVLQFVGVVLIPSVPRLCRYVMEFGDLELKAYLNYYIHRYIMNIEYPYPMSSVLLSGVQLTP